MNDFVIPENNEEEFLDIAEELGYDTIYFLYNFNDFLKKQDQKTEIKHKKIKTYQGILADSKNIDKVKKLSGDKKVFVVIKSSNKDREIIEGRKANLIFSFEDNTKKDFAHQRASGLNHIICKLAKDNDVTIGFSISFLLRTEKIQQILGRMMQNIRLCRKFNVNMIFASFAKDPFEMRSAHDIKSLINILSSDKIS